MVYIIVSLVIKNQYTTNEIVKQHNFAFLIPARNEQNVIFNLIDSIVKQNYLNENITVFVLADNCTDKTYEVASSAGAIVYKRQNKFNVGKGYALDFLIKKIDLDYGLGTFDGFFIFDADNVLDENYISEMNKLFNNGFKILTSYRNSKNYATNWISAGYSLWFLREAKFMNNSRMLLNTGCAISGTGFLVSTDIIKENSGWPFYLLTEDIEFSICSSIKGNTIGYCENAIFYDEQPETFLLSWSQRMRWTKGFYQVFNRYGIPLIRSIFLKRSFYAFDMFMTILPGLIITSLTMAVNIIVILVGYVIGMYVIPIVTMFLLSLLTLYLILFTVGLITTITEWNMIHCKNIFKIIYLFTFPIFILTYIPIAIAAMFLKVDWKPIEHRHVKNLSDIRNKCNY